MPKIFHKMGKSLVVVLGGGIQQTRCIRRCMKIGFRVCCFDINENCKGANVADLFYRISIRNYSKILSVVSKLQNVVAILAPATEVGNRVASIISAKLGLPYNSQEVIKRTTNKALMREKLDLLNLDNPKYFYLSGETRNELPSSLEENSLSYPCIVKPADSSAGRGITFCNTPEDIKESVSYALKESHDSLVIVENIINGPQFSLETLSFNGKHKLIAIAAQTMDLKEKHVEVGHILPAPISKRNYSVLEKYAMDLLNGFEIKFGACHIEIRVVDQRIYTIDFASRMGGWRDLMIESVFGERYIDAYVKSHFQNEVEIKNLESSFESFSVSEFCVARMAFNLEDIHLLNDLKLEGKCEFASVDQKVIEMNLNDIKGSLSNSAGHFLYKSTLSNERSIVDKYKCVDLTKDFVNLR